MAHVSCPRGWTAASSHRFFDWSLATHPKDLQGGLDYEDAFHETTVESCFLDPIKSVCPRMCVGDVDRLIALAGFQLAVNHVATGNSYHQWHADRGCQQLSRRQGESSFGFASRRCSGTPLRDDTPDAHVPQGNMVVSVVDHANDEVLCAAFIVKQLLPVHSLLERRRPMC